MISRFGFFLFCFCFYIFFEVFHKILIGRRIYENLRKTTKKKKVKEKGESMIPLIVKRLRKQ